MVSALLTMEIIAEGSTVIYDLESIIMNCCFGLTRKEELF